MQEETVSRKQCVVALGISRYCRPRKRKTWGGEGGPGGVETDQGAHTPPASLLPLLVEENGDPWKGAQEGANNKAVYFGRSHTPPGRFQSALQSP